MSQQSAQPPQAAIAARIRDEFNEMPGLRLTAAQVRRLCAIDAAACERALADLAREGFLSRDSRGLFVRAASARRSA